MAAELFIDHAGQRRYMSRPLNIAGTPEVLLDLAAQIMAQAQRAKTGGQASCYVQVVLRQEPLGDMPAMPWAAAEPQR